MLGIMSQRKLNTNEGFKIHKVHFIQRADTAAQKYLSEGVGRLKSKLLYKQYLVQIETDFSFK